MTDETANRALKQRAEDYRKVFFGSEAGKRVFGTLLLDSRVFDLKPLFNAEVHYREGQRAFMGNVIIALGMDTEEGLVELLRFMHVSLAQYRKIQEESNG